MALSRSSSNGKRARPAQSNAAEEKKDNEILREIAELHKNSDGVITKETFWKTLIQPDNKRSPKDFAPKLLLYLLRLPRKLHHDSTAYGHSKLTAEQYHVNLIEIFIKFANVISEIPLPCSESDVKRALLELRQAEVLITREDAKQVIDLIREKLIQDLTPIINEIYTEPQPQKRAKKPDVPKTHVTEDGRQYQMMSVDNKEFEFSPISAGRSRRSHEEKGLTIISPEPGILNVKTGNNGQENNVVGIMYPDSVSHGNEKDVVEEGFHNPKSNTLGMVRKEQQQ